MIELTMKFKKFKQTNKERRYNLDKITDLEQGEIGAELAKTISANKEGNQWCIRHGIE